MSGSSGLEVDAPQGPRWELALGLIESGESPVLLGPVELRRGVSGPLADGVISVVVRSSTSAPTYETARTDVNVARAVIASATAADPRLQDLLTRYGSRWELVDDYGMGTLLLAVVDDAGGVSWAPDRESS
jgi:hypothetical protein